MGIELATIGTLVSIGKNVIDAVKALKGAVSLKDNESDEKMKALEEAFNNFSGRISVLAEQLEQSERLTRQVPAWLEVASRMPMWKSIEQMDEREAKDTLEDLKRFIFDSIRDHFSGTFFHTDFDKLPELQRKIEFFRDRLTTLDNSLKPIAPGNLAVFKGMWPQIVTQFNDATNSASEIQRQADDVQAELIKELKETSLGI